MMRKQHDNTLIYAAAYALAGMHVVVTIAAAGLIALQLGVKKDIATLPVSSYIIGVMLTAFPAAITMKKTGRKKGFMIGACASLMGAAITIIAMVQPGDFIKNYSFVFLCIATFLVGAGQAFALQCRFAAADEVEEKQKAKAIAYVTVGGLVSAVAAPIMLMVTKNILGVEYSATFILLIFIAGGHIAILTRLKNRDDETHIQQNSYPPRKTRDIISQSGLIFAIVCGMASYATMNFVMTATPIAMVKLYDFSPNQAFWVIQWHIIAMFAPGFFTGHLIRRYGDKRVILFGFLLFAFAAMTMLMGQSFAHFAFALILLGVGWNFSFVGATDMVAKCYRASEKNKIQGLNDSLIFSATALASFMSGVVLAVLSWEGIALAIFPIMTFIFVVFWVISLKSRGFGGQVPQEK